jgi:hypothetical protein
LGGILVYAQLPGGLIFLSVPAKTDYHPYPSDNWRFFPDSAKALEKWARKKGEDIVLIYSNRETGEGVVDQDMIYWKRHPEVSSSVQDALVQKFSDLVANLAVYDKVVLQLYEFPVIEDVGKFLRQNLVHVPTDNYFFMPTELIEYIVLQPLISPFCRANFQPPVLPRKNIGKTGVGIYTVVHGQCNFHVEMLVSKEDVLNMTYLLDSIHEVIEYYNLGDTSIQEVLLRDIMDEKLVSLVLDRSKSS